MYYKQEERERGRRIEGVSVERGCVCVEGVRESVCVYCKEGREKCVCTLCLASMYIPDNALHIHVYVHVSLTDTIIQLH